MLAVLTRDPIANGSDVLSVQISLSDVGERDGITNLAISENFPSPRR